MKLIACLEGQVAGTITFTGSRATFIYETSWLSVPGNYPLSQALPMQPKPITGSVITHFLWGLLPDNEHTLDAWARQFRVSARDPVALLAHVGEDCAGAVQFVAPERVAEIARSETRPSQIEWLSDAEFERRIQRLSRDSGDGRATPDEGQFSLSGAQSKTALYFDAKRNRWGIPRGRTPTTHILKPTSNDFEGFAENEHFCLTLTRRMGIAAAQTQWRSIGGIPTLISQRYDRAQIGVRWIRIHQEDCCQALGISPSRKYENEGGPGFKQIMTLLNGSDEPEQDRDRLMRAACLVFLLAATDAHSKNFSLLYLRGTEKPSMRLAPLYDVASAWPYPRRIPIQKMKLAMRIGRHYKINQIQPRHFDSLANACNYPADKLRAMLMEMAGRLPDEASTLVQESRSEGMAAKILASLTDKLSAQCRAVIEWR